MTEIVYDVPINEVAKILEKSDRQVRRYVKEKRLKAKPVRVDGHMKLMFNRDQVVAFKDKFLQDGILSEPSEETIVEAQVVQDDTDSQADGTETEAPVIDAQETGDSFAVKYVIDTLKDQIDELKNENRELHYQLEQRSGHVGFLQGKIESLQEEIKMLAPAKKSSEERKPWYRRIFGRGQSADTAQTS